MGQGNSSGTLKKKVKYRDCLAKYNLFEHSWMPTLIELHESKMRVYHKSTLIRELLINRDFNIVSENQKGKSLRFLCVVSSLAHMCEIQGSSKDLIDFKSFVVRVKQHQKLELCHICKAEFNYNRPTYICNKCKKEVCPDCISGKDVCSNCQTESKPFIRVNKDPDGEMSFGTPVFQTKNPHLAFTFGDPEDAESDF